MLTNDYILLAMLRATLSHDLMEVEKLLPLEASAWNEVIGKASAHGVSGLLYSVVEQLPKSLRPPLELLLQLYGLSERRKKNYEHQFQTASLFASALKARGIEMKVLKGLSFSTYYEHPELRECGDCDCYLSRIEKGSKGSSGSKAGAKGFEVGNKTILEMGGSSEFGSYKHSHLFLNGLMFENHHYITDFNGTQRGKTIELLLEKAIDSSSGNRIGETDMVCPCAYFNALHLIRHAQGNFISEGLILRMIYDWAMLLRVEQEHLDWSQLYSDLEVCGLRQFAEVMTTICVEYLGLRLTVKEVTLCKNKKMVEAVLKDTLGDSIRMTQGESLGHKIIGIMARYGRFWRYRNLAIESVPVMIWNSLAFSSFMKRNISLE